MTLKEVKAELKAVILRKGIDNILNADLNEINERTGATYGQLQNALNYFRCSNRGRKEVAR